MEAKGKEQKRDVKWALEVGYGGFPGGGSGEESSCQCRRHEMQVRSLGWEAPLEQEMATPSTVSQRVGLYVSDLAGYGVV